MRQILRKIAAKERARWLAELAEAIDEAQRLAWRIGFIDRVNQDALEIYVRLEIVRVEVESIRGSGWACGPANVSPKRSDLLPEDES